MVSIEGSLQGVSNTGADAVRLGSDDFLSNVSVTYNW